ncbi:polyketide synthase [Dendronalium sp. ChiSLP03b]|uniref:polyketide synthase n=1 Tax=Dendronalium sp. ChiSLP03b TaxID=3075381 RepID=UPI002AD50F57|nr:polyketide synthase [Dendronalium sp. ChiSLP03b]MDZ8206606.1 beta-ketoacyl synthase N-terminal-like domain-containing protein [Dendronalium sp. ChiSLP03b]
MLNNHHNLNEQNQIAVIGMAGRFPGAKNVDIFWQNIRDGVESISFFTDEELVSTGIDPVLLNQTSYVKAGGVLEDIELFDASFFGFLPKEAEITDPQHRLFLECVWEALENAGYNPQIYDGQIGLFAGVAASNYLLSNLYPNRKLMESVDNFQLLIANDKDFLPTQVSYKLNLKGPSINVQTACSTSLVAVHLACQSLLNGESDMALAGGVSILLPQKFAYQYQEGGIHSPDGHCRAFDAKAKGTVGSNGLGVVVLKRLEDAIADGDLIYAVIKGSAVNNDGSLKVGYTAPSIDGQREVILEALALAGVEPETIAYVETHGTGTALGDPIEIKALTQAFRTSTNKKNFCAIASVKTNIGHLNTAAGVTGLIKTVLALKNQQIPPSLHFEKPNPEIDFANSPFYINTKLSPWQTNGTPRRAGVSSFGIGGTNAHVILEQAPGLGQGSRKAGEQGRKYQLLLLSAKTSTALETATANLLTHLQQHPQINLADVAYTLQIGRQAFEHRRLVVCRDLNDAVEVLSSQNPQRVLTHHHKSRHCPVVFMFSGQGAQYVNMAWELYEVEPTFRQHVDTCAQILEPHLNFDIRQILFSQDPKTASQQLQQTAITQPALFVIEYALAQLWMEWGVHPEAMIGHSIGEYVAATIAGVFSLEDALAVVAIRGRLMQQLPTGSMLAIPLPAENVRSLLVDETSVQIAAINSPSSCVVSGNCEAIAAFQERLSSQEIECRLLHTSHAFHSQMMSPILEEFVQLVKKVKLNSPRIRFISNVTGSWITQEQTTDPDYWCQHLRQTVRFSDGISQLLEQFEGVFLEVGPGQTLSTLIKQHLDRSAKQLILTSLRHVKEQESDVAWLLQTLSRLWLFGVDIDWSGFYTHERRHRLPLPTYPFERQKYWIEPQKLAPSERQFKPKLKASELWKSLVETALIQETDGIKGFDRQTYLANKQWLDRLCAGYINLTLRRLGAFKNPDQKYSIEELFEQCQIIPQYRQLLYRWLDVLLEQGHLQQDKEIFTNLLPCSTDSINVLAQEVRVRWADTPQVIDQLQICGENLADVMIGKKQPLELFVALRNKESENSNPKFSLDKYYKEIMQTILQQVVRLVSSEVNLKILEIGAGQGLATAELLPVLPSEQTNYTFTDVGVLFLDEAQQKFNAYPFIEYRLLDIEQPPQEQGYKSHNFDVVIAYNVLHVTQSIGKTLQHIRSLLAPEGLLLIWESTQPEPAFDISWGLLMNPLEDDERSRGNPFLSKQQWCEALRTHGFVEVAAFPETEALGQHILLAQAASSTALQSASAFTTTLEQKDPSKTRQVSLDKKPDIADWFYIPSWKRSMAPQPFNSKVQTTQQRCWLVFADECGLGEKMVQQLELADHDVIIVKVGERFARENNSPQQVYTINPRQPDDYDALFKELLSLNKIPKTIVHLWSVTSNHHAELSIESLEKSQYLGFYSLVFLAQALGENHQTHSLEIVIVSDNMQDVTGEEMLCPEKAMVLGPCKVISQEYPNIICRSIDVVIPVSESWQEDKLIDRLLDELHTQTSDRVVAYRGHHRWVQTFEPVRLDESVEGKPRFREEGVYLITGGLGGVGLLNAEYLAKTVRAKLLLIGRSAFPEKDEWSEWLSTHDEQDSVSHKIRKLQELETLGAEVLVINADVINLEHMKAAIAQAKNRFGSIHGVIHNASENKQELIAQNTLLKGIVFTPKVIGTSILHDLFKDTDLDFFVLTSSQASITGGIGQVEYTARCAFIDAFARYSNLKHGKFIRAMNWNRWKTSEWIAKTNIEGASGLTLEEAALTPEEGMEAFRRILSSSTVPQVVVSNSDLNNLINRNLINLKDTINSLSEEFSKVGRVKPTHKRPNLGNAYIPPRNEIELTLADIWQETFGIEQVSIDDNFFELGGDSLLATIVLSRLRKTFKIELPYKAFFDKPTVADLAEVIARILAEQTDREQQAQMLAEIENLSEDEAQTILVSKEQLVEAGD